MISSIASTQQKIGTNRVQVSITPVLDPPVLEVLDIELVQVGERVLISPIVSIIDGSNSDLFFELATAPQNAVINPRTGQLVWVPGVEHVGLQLFRIDAKRGGGSASTGSVTFDLRVVAPESLSLSADETSGVSLRWQSGTNSLFRIQVKDDLNDPVWIDLGEQSGVEGSFEFMEVDIDRPQRFYRLRRIR